MQLALDNFGNTYWHRALITYADNHKPGWLVAQRKFDLRARRHIPSIEKPSKLIIHFDV